MSESVVDPCLWDIDPGECCSGLPDGTDPAVIAGAVAEASRIMRALSGRMIGQCTQTLRPLHMCSSCRAHCCGGADGVALSGLDGEVVSEVLAVRIGPDTVDPAEYWFEDGMLWRIPPNRWPRRDRKWQACGTGTAFCVDVLAGLAPDPWALNVAQALVCELAKACVGQKCRLPRNTTSINAQGVTVTIDPQDLSAYIPEVAAWAKMVNPRKSTLPATVWSPDTDGGRAKRDNVGGISWLRR